MGSYTIVIFQSWGGGVPAPVLTPMGLLNYHSLGNCKLRSPLGYIDLLTPTRLRYIPYTAKHIWPGMVTFLAHKFESHGNLQIKCSEYFESGEKNVLLSTQNQGTIGPAKMYECTRENAL